MSVRLRITIPDGELEAHLKGRSSKGAAVEIIRLATNYLCIARNIEKPIFETGSGLGIKSYKEPKRLSAIDNDNDVSEESLNTLVSEGDVDFGSDLLEME
ncbi:MAG: hypothetical protein ACI9T7_000024 [Oleiphilaceae bacterium]|jgi:hypothetical protein